MRLLKTGPYKPGHEKLELVQVYGRNVPEYVILSHTWSQNADDEVLFTDIQNEAVSATKKRGFEKLNFALRQAVQDGYGYLWVDSCCIDKSSSAELTEAINSMFVYYRNAAICYAFLEDVNSDDPPSFRQARWWSRGWTLQELIAPDKLIFFSQTWSSLGTKMDLASIIEKITGIDVVFLTGVLPLADAAVAKRMSWCSRRETTREEDLAYCLMGLFSVNMPMLYGEGGYSAFRRLQEEIMRRSDDQSLFAWIDETGESHGLLADSPKAFAHTGNVQPYGDFIQNARPYVMTNRGLQISLHLTPKGSGVVVAALRCPVPNEGYTGFLGVYLTHLGGGSQQYIRQQCGKLASITQRGSLQEVYVRQVDAGAPSGHQFMSLLQQSNTDYSMIAGLRALSDDSTMQYPPPASNAPRWKTDHPHACTAVFRIVRQPRKVSAVVTIERARDDARFNLLLGATSVNEVGFSVSDYGIALSVDDLVTKEYALRPSGEAIELERSRVRVRVTLEAQMWTNKKVFVVHVNLEDLPVSLMDDIFEAADNILKGGAPATNPEVLAEPEFKEPGKTTASKHPWSLLSLKGTTKT